MIERLKRYPKMKDSGVPWLAEVPEHWALPRLGALLRERGEVNVDGKVTSVLSVMRDRGVIPYEEKGNVGNKKSDDITRYKIVRPDDIVVNSMNVIIGSVGMSRYTGCLSPVYYVLARRSNADDARFLDMVFQTKPFQRSLVRIGNGILSHRMRIPMELLKAEPIPRPPVDEQVAIVRFIGHADLRIRRYIRAKQRLIKLLEEQKQAIIHRAVTRGLTLDVRQKDSGAAWLGKVPEHWQVIPLRRVTVARCDGPFGSGLKAAHYTDEGVRVVRLRNIGHAAFKDADKAFISLQYYKTLGDHDVHEGDLLVAGLGDERHPAGRACVAPKAVLPAMVKADCFRFRVMSQRFDPEFAALQLTATAAAASAILSTGATRQRTNLESTASRLVAIPPLEEQRAIVTRVKTEIATVHDSLGHAARAMNLVKEYRTRLIADAVTGKLDVRDALSVFANGLDEAEYLDEHNEPMEGEGVTDDPAESSDSEE